MGLRTCWLCLRWWLAGTVFQPRVPCSQARQELEASSASLTGLVCQAARQSFLLWNEASLTVTPALAAPTLLGFPRGHSPERALGPATSPSSPSVVCFSDKAQEGKCPGLVGSKNAPDATATDSTWGRRWVGGAGSRSERQRREHSRAIGGRTGAGTEVGKVAGKLREGGETAKRFI